MQLDLFKRLCDQTLFFSDNVIRHYINNNVIRRYIIDHVIRHNYINDHVPCDIDDHVICDINDHVIYDRKTLDCVIIGLEMKKNNIVEY